MSSELLRSAEKQLSKVRVVGGCRGQRPILFWLYMLAGALPELVNQISYINISRIPNR